MSNDAPSNTVELHRVLKSTPDRVYRAFTTAAAYAKWLPPHGFTATVHEMDARVGGSYKMSFTNFTNGQSDSFGGEYLALVPGERVAYTAEFSDPAIKDVSKCAQHPLPAPNRLVDRIRI